MFKLQNLDITSYSDPACLSDFIALLYNCPICHIKFFILVCELLCKLMITVFLWFFVTALLLLIHDKN